MFHTQRMQTLTILWESVVFAVHVFLFPSQARWFCHRRGNYTKCEKNTQMKDRNSTTDSAMDTPRHSQPVAYKLHNSDTLDVDFPFNKKSWSQLNCPYPLALSSNMKSRLIDEEFVITLPVPIRFCKHCLLEVRIIRSNSSKLHQFLCL